MSITPVGQIWFDTATSELKMYDGMGWITIRKMPYTQDPFNTRAKFVKRFAFLPHKCHLTGRKIWLEWAIRGELIDPNWNNTYPKLAGTYKEFRWYDKFEYLNWAIANA